MPTGLWYLLRQYSGFTLGSASVFLTWYTHDPESPHVMASLWACCGLGVVALILHELRPYKVSGVACLVTVQRTRIVGRAFC